MASSFVSVFFRKTSVYGNAVLGAQFEPWLNVQIAFESFAKTYTGPS